MRRNGPVLLEGTVCRRGCPVLVLINHELLTILLSLLLMLDPSSENDSLRLLIWPAEVQRHVFESLGSTITWPLSSVSPMSHCSNPQLLTPYLRYLRSKMWAKTGSQHFHRLHMQDDSSTFSHAVFVAWCSRFVWLSNSMTSDWCQHQSLLRGLSGFRKTI